MLSENKHKSNQNRGLCVECQTGILKRRYLTYFTWLNDELITVPNFPSWVCDVCGRREYDKRSILWLNTILNPETGRRTSPQQKTGITRTNQSPPRSTN